MFDFVLGDYDKVSQESDLNVIAGVLQYALKEMRFSPTYEIYGELADLGTLCLLSDVLCSIKTCL